jgi:hypothetical protein
MASADGQAPDPLTDAVLKLAGLAAQVERVEQSARQRFGELATACAEALAQVTAVRQEAGILGDRADGIERKLAELGALLSQMSSRITEMNDSAGPGGGKNAGNSDSEAPYEVNQAPPWWQPENERTVATTSRLRDWVDEVYRPGFGHLGKMLGDCWDRHPLCVAYLDTLHEAWCLLYIPTRDPKMVFAQLDWLTRPLLQAAEVMAAETRPCLQHGHREPGQDISPFTTWASDRR